METTQPPSAPISSADVRTWNVLCHASALLGLFLHFLGHLLVEEVEDSLASDYEEAKPSSALPWDTVRPAVSSVWERMSGVLSPREPGRGVRDFI
ncbi:MAG: hypothetical protein DME42_11340 [Verrucomicrobia bacterium]|nr:MAG: hypothetical protein DME42_11340 [Verrucomicrobiota bacterium]